MTTTQHVFACAPRIVLSPYDLSRFIPRVPPSGHCLGEWPVPVPATG